VVLAVVGEFAVAQGEPGSPAGLTLVPQFRYDTDVSRLAFSPDGTRLLSGLSPSRLVVRDTATGDEVRTVRPPSWDYIPGPWFSPDGALVGWYTERGEVTVCDPQTGETIRVLSMPDDAGARRMALSPDHRTLAVVVGERTVTLWDIPTGNQLATLEDVHEKTVNACEFDADGKRLATGDETGRLVVWDVTARGRQHSWQAVPDLLRSPVFSPDGQLVICQSGRDGQLAVWDLASEQRLGTLGGPPNDASQLAFSRDGRSLAAAYVGEAVVVWDFPSGRERFRIAAETFAADAGPAGGAAWGGGPVPPPPPGPRPWWAGVAFSPDGRGLAVGGPLGAIRLYDAATGELLRPVVQPATGVTWSGLLAVSADGRWLATGMRDGAVGLWDLQTGQLRWQSKGGPHTGVVRALAFTRNSRLLASFADDGSMATWDVETGEVLSDAVVEPSYSAACAPDAGVVVTAGKENQMRTWDLETGRPRGDLLGLPRGASSVAISPDGQLVAAGGAFLNGVLLWDRQTGAEVRRLETAQTCTNSLAFSDDGGLLVSTDPQSWPEPAQLHIWDVATGMLKASFPMASSAGDVAFSADGRAVAAALGRCSRVWHLMTQQAPRSFPASPLASIQSVAFSRSGRLLVEGADDGTLLVRDWQTGQLRATLWSCPGPEEVETTEWITWTPEGYYDCSPGGEAFVRARDAAGVLHPAQEYVQPLHDPEKLRSVLPNDKLHEDTEVFG
jgi:WD40 repeat protein